MRPSAMDNPTKDEAPKPPKRPWVAPEVIVSEAELTGGHPSPGFLESTSPPGNS